MFIVVFGVTLSAHCVILLLSHQRIIFFLPLSSGENFSLHLLSVFNICALNSAFATTYIFPFPTLKALSSWMEVKYCVLEVGQKGDVNICQTESIDFQKAILRATTA